MSASEAHECWMQKADTSQSVRLKALSEASTGPVSTYRTHSESQQLTSPPHRSLLPKAQWMSLSLTVAETR